MNMNDVLTMNDFMYSVLTAYIMLIVMKKHCIIVTSITDRIHRYCTHLHDQLQHHHFGDHST